MKNGAVEYAALEREASSALAKRGWQVEYIAVRRQADLGVPARGEQKLVVLAAARLGKTRLIAIVGLITGIAAALSMAGSEYLSTKEEGLRSPVKACVYTGIAYIFTVILLILPFFIFNNPFAALGSTIFFVVCVIFIFTFYVAVAKGLSFKPRFLEMLGIALGVAALNFLIGLAVKKYINVEI